MRAIILAIAVLAVMGAAQAGEGPRWRQDRPHWHHRPVDPAPGFWGGVLGGIIGGMLKPDDPAPPPVPERPLEPWTPEWYDFCGNKYRTFDPKTGYYNGFDGEKHFCIGA